MAPWGPVFQRDPEGDFTLNISNDRPTFLPPGPAAGKLERRRTNPSPLRPILAAPRNEANLELRGPRDYVDGQIVTTVARSPRRQSHRRATSTSFRNYDTTVRSPRSSLSPAVRFQDQQSPRLAPLSPMAPRETYFQMPQPDPIIVVQPQPYPVEVRQPLDPRGVTAPPAPRATVATAGSDDEYERPSITVADSSRRRNREREYRDEARRRRNAGRAPPERDATDSESDAQPAPRSLRRAYDVRTSVSTPPAPQTTRDDRSGSSRSNRNSSSSTARHSRDSPRDSEYTRTTEYRRTYEYERNGPSREREAPRSAPPTQVSHSRSPSARAHNGSGSGSSRASAVAPQRPRARTDASGFLTPTVSHSDRSNSSSRPLLLEDATADRAKHLVEERTIFGNGRKTRQYTYV